MEKGFVGRAREVEALLGDPRTTFLVVTTLETAPGPRGRVSSPASSSARDYHLGAIIANRVLPSALTRRGAATSAKRLGRQAADDDALVAAVAAELAGRTRPTRRARSSRDVLDRGRRRASTTSPLVATREAERRAELAELAPQVLDVPVARLATSTTSPA